MDHAIRLDEGDARVFFQGVKRDGRERGGKALQRVVIGEMNFAAEAMYDGVGHQLRGKLAALRRTR